MLAAQRQTGVVPQILRDRPKCPEGCETVWEAFRALRSSTPSGMGPNRISFSEIDAFQRVTGVRLAKWEVEAIRRADRAYMEDWQSRQPKS